MIELTGLHRRFGRRVAVDCVDLTVEPGEVVALLGPNGAGKTTTLRMISGYLEPTLGQARVLGHVVADDPLPVRERLGYLPEGAPLWPETTPRALLDFCARLHRLPSGDRQRRCAEIAARLQLGDVLDQRVETLSRGYRRRVALAVALLHEPDVLVLDEPTEGLDPNQKHEVRTLLRSLAPTRTIILSTHLLEEVEALCTRVAVIHGGRIVADASPAALRARSRWEGAVSARFAAGAPADGDFAALPVAEAVRDADGTLTLFPAAGTSPDVLRQGLLDAAARLGTEVVELHVHTGRLDEVFGDLTERPAAEAASR